MIARIDEARSNGDTVGGVFEVVAHGLPIGLGSYVHWDRRLDAALAAAVMSINTGGVTNGQPLVVRGAVKPISTLARPLASADLLSGEPVEKAHYERSDISVVPAAGVVAEAMVMLTLADAVLDKFGGDSLAETKANAAAYRERISRAPDSNV